MQGGQVGGGLPPFRPRVLPLPPSAVGEGIYGPTKHHLIIADMACSASRLSNPVSPITPDAISLWEAYLETTKGSICAAMISFTFAKIPGEHQLRYVRASVEGILGIRTRRPLCFTEGFIHQLWFARLCLGCVMTCLSFRKLPGTLKLLIAPC